MVSEMENALNMRRFLCVDLMSADVARDWTGAFAVLEHKANWAEYTPVEYFDLKKKHWAGTTGEVMGSVPWRLCAAKGNAGLERYASWFQEPMPVDSTKLNFDDCTLSFGCADQDSDDIVAYWEDGVSWPMPSVTVAEYKEGKVVGKHLPWGSAELPAPKRTKASKAKTGEPDLWAGNHRDGGPVAVRHSSAKEKKWVILWWTPVDSCRKQAIQIVINTLGEQDQKKASDFMIGIAKEFAGGLPKTEIEKKKKHFAKCSLGGAEPAGAKPAGAIKAKPAMAIKAKPAMAIKARPAACSDFEDEEEAAEEEAEEETAENDEEEAESPEEEVEEEATMPDLASCLPPGDLFGYDDDL
jgi:hypothetical protein